jgi:hypothetical protein
MKYRSYPILFILLVLASGALAQKAFTEGVVIYKIKFEPPGQKEVSGEYLFTIKGSQIKKELRLNNGYQDIMLINCGTNTIHSLQNRNGKKYAIELNIAELRKNEEKYGGFALKNEEHHKKNIAGYAVYKGDVHYKDGSRIEVYYTKDWFPSLAITFERFPDAKFFPMYFTYKDENNVTMTFEAEKIAPGPVENSVFRIPADYKMITYEEYKQMSK